MRKVLCLILIFVFVLSVSCLASAASNVIDDPTSTEYISPDDIVCVPVVEVPTNASSKASTDDVMTEVIPADEVVEGPLPEVPQETLDAKYITESSAPISPYAAVRFEFNGLAPNITYIASSDVVISANELVTLKVDPCVWAPEDYELHIGFWNISTNVAYYKTATGGNISKTYYFTSIPAGTYRVYVMNMGDQDLTTGYMKYTVS